MDATGHELWADRLAAAMAGQLPIEALTVAEPGLTVSDAYAIQMAGVSQRIKAGAG